VVEALLLDYYDPRYAHSMRAYRYARTVDSTHLDVAAAELETFASDLDEVLDGLPDAAPASASVPVSDETGAPSRYGVG
jgi:hypothetical protein